MALKNIEPALLLKYLDDGEWGLHTSNYFGGRPHLPEEIEWPTNSKGEPLHHLLQLDCESLPRSFVLGGQKWELPSFPDTGTFFLFVNMIDYDIWQDPENAARVIYYPHSVAGVPPRNPPINLAPLGSESRTAKNFYALNSFSVRPTATALRNYAVVGEGNAATRMLHERLQNLAASAFPPSQLLPKIPFSPQPYLTTYSTWKNGTIQSDEKELLEQFGVNAIWPKRYLAATQRYLPWMQNVTANRRKKELEHVTHVRKSFGREVRSQGFDVPETGFPWRWLAVGMIALRVFKWSCENLEKVEKYWPSALQEAEGWMRRAKRRDPAEPITAADSAEFIDWMRRIDDVAATQSDKKDWVDVIVALKRLQIELVDTLDLSLAHLRSDRDTSDLPPELVAPERLTPDESERETSQVDGFQMHHQFLGYARRWQSEEPDNSEDMLLFQVASDNRNLNVEFGILHVWIKKKDFATGDFQRAWAQAETT